MALKQQMSAKNNPSILVIRHEAHDFYADLPGRVPREEKPYMGKRLLAKKCPPKSKPSTLVT